MTDEGSFYRKVEETIDNEIADAVQVFLNRIQSERSRVLEEAHEQNVSYGNSVKITFEPLQEFAQLLEHLTKIPFGFVKSDEKDKEGKGKQNCSSLGKCRKRSRHIGSAARFEYDEMQVVGEFKGHDRFGRNLATPSSIVAIPDKRSFAVMHKSSISIFSGTARLESTFKFIDPFKELGSLWKRENKACQRFVTINESTGQLICIDHGAVKTIDPDQMPYHKTLSVVYPARRIAFPKKRVPIGLAVSPSSNCLFTAIGSKIRSYSLSSWSLQDEVVPILPNWLTTPSFYILGIRRNRLFFTSSLCYRTLNVIPIDMDSGQFSEEPAETLSPHKFRAITFDPEDRLLVVNADASYVEVLSSDGQDLITTFRPKCRFAPNDIAILTPTRPGEDPFLFDNFSCSRIVATPDYSNGKVTFFGVPEDNN